MRTATVVVGGSVGALARWAVGLAIVAGINGFPWATLIVNVSGAFGLSLAATLLNERIAPTRYMRNLINIGFFGAYTTFSTMALEGVRLMTAGRTSTALTYWVATLVLGQMAGVYGMWLGRLQLPARRERVP